jgi:hypothetical protein
MKTKVFVVMCRNTNCHSCAVASSIINVNMKMCSSNGFYPHLSKPNIWGNARNNYWSQPLEEELLKKVHVTEAIYLRAPIGVSQTRQLFLVA